jgi:manganese/zinc/iron transport system substrate-binding protein
MNRLAIAGLFLAGSLAMVGLPGCGNGDKGPDILCTTNDVADVVRQVAGEHQTVGVLMGEGVDPHTYDPTPADARALRNARMVFYSGYHLEGKMTELLRDMGSRKPVVAVAEKLNPSRILREGGKEDPHLWFDLELWSGTAEVVAEVLAKEDPRNASDYRANARRYRDSLLAAHKELKDQILTIPDERRVLVTAHDAFEYFGRAYETKVRAIQGISTESKAGLKEINDLVSYLTDKKIKAIFVESSVSPKNVESVQEGCRKRGHSIEIGGELFSDSIGKEGTPDGTLEGAMRHNVRTIVNALK